MSRGPVHTHSLHLRARFLQVRAQLVDLVAKPPLNLDPTLSAAQAERSAALVAEATAALAAAQGPLRGSPGTAEAASAAAAAVAGLKSKRAPEALLKCLAAGLFLNAAMLIDDDGHAGSSASRQQAAFRQSSSNLAHLGGEYKAKAFTVYSRVRGPKAVTMASP